MVSDYLSWCVFSHCRTQTDSDAFLHLAAFNKGLGVAVRALITLLEGFFVLSIEAFSGSLRPRSSKLTQLPFIFNVILI